MALAHRDRSSRSVLLRRLLSAALAALLVNVAVPGGSVAAADEPTTYIVVFRPGVAANAKTDDVERRIGFSSDFRYTSALQGFAARLTSFQLARLRADPDVAFVSADRVLHTIGVVPIKAGDTAPPGVQRLGAATTTNVREASTSNVAVIDSGIDLSHTDLNAVNGKNCISGGNARDDNGHGTHVAGTIGAKNNGAGVVGVAPGTKLYAVKVVNAQGSGTDAQVICGIDWVTANAAALGIKVANVSLGGPGADDGNCGNTNGDALHRAICNSVAAGVTYVVAAGNSSEDFSADVPASYNEVLTVTAMADFDGLSGGLGTPSCGDGYFEDDDAAAGFSNFTSDGSADAAHAIAGPGVCILSTWPGNKYQTISGTSMASPHVAGVVALCFGEKGAAGPCSGLTPAQIIAKMRANAAGHTASNPAAGFVGDPSHPVDAYYGYLAWAGAVDTVAPVVTSVSSSAVTHEAARITWTTDENADSQVEYGTTATYGLTTPVAPAFVTSHVVDLSGLSPTTPYHYRVKSRDGWGNLAVSGDFTFTTTIPLSDLALTGRVSPEPANVGDTLAYQLTLNNKGPARASGGTLSVTLGTGLTPGAATPSQGTCSTAGQVVSCNVGTVEVGGPTTQTLADHPSGFWRVGDPAGSATAADASGNGLVGAVDPGVALGQPGALSGDTAATSNGSGATITVSASPRLELTSAVSVEAWVRPTLAGQNGGIFEKTVNGWVNSQYMLFLEAGFAKFRVRTASGALLPVTGPTLPLNTWTHLVGTFDGTTLRLYVNGSLTASATAQGPLASGSGPAFIGRLGQNLYPFQGSLDEVAVFPVALSADRVRNHYLGGAVTLGLSATATVGGTVHTTAQAQATEADPVSSNNTLSLDSTITTPRADLALTGSVSPEPANVGDTLTYQLTLANNGPARATSGTLQVTMPAGLTPGSAISSQGSCASSGQVTNCALGAIEVGGPTQQVLTDHPLGFWRLGDAAGSSSALDASGNGLTGAVDPGVNFRQPAAISGETAATFPGSGPAIVVPASAVLDLASAVSVEAWVRPTLAGQNGGIYEKTVNGWVNSQYMLFLEAGVAKFRVRTASGALLPVDGPALALNTWSHLVGTFDGSALRLYVNGALAATSAAAGPLNSGSGPSFIGRLGQNLYPFQGSIDEVAVFSGALSPDRVRGHYVGGVVSIRVNATATAGGALRTTASATAAESDPDLSNNTVDFNSTINSSRADLALAGTVSPEPANVGDTLTYQLTLANKGPARASTGTVQVTLASSLTAGTATASQGSCSASGQIVSCALGALDVSSPSAQVLADHPSGYWRLGDPAGSAVALDASGNGISGGVDAGVSLGQPGAVGGDTAATFPGSGPAITVAPSAVLDLANAVSVEAWVRPTSAGQNGAVFEKTVNGWVNSQYMLFLEAGVAKFRVRTTSGALLPVDGPTLPLNTWTHLVGTFDGTTLQLYVNGVLAASAAAQGPLNSGSGTAFIGRLGQNLYPFQGSLDEVAVFPTVLSPERIRAHYLGGVVTVQLTATATAGGTVRTTVQAQATETDPDPSNNTLSLDSTVH